MQSKRPRILFVTAFAVVLVFLTIAAPLFAASTEKVVYSFCTLSNCTDGSSPSGLISDAAGNLYGTTEWGGAHGSGTVFQLTPRTNGKWKEKVVYSFCTRSNCTDGARPKASLIFDARGNLYGTTEFGGSNGCHGTTCGIVFQLAPRTNGKWKEKVLHGFGRGKDGYKPTASLIFDPTGNLYGTTAGGGSVGLGLGGTAAYGGAYEFYGTVFRLASGTSGRWKETVLHSFTDNGTDGYYPYASLTFDAAGNLYGTTLEGGASGCAGGYETCGTIFKITP